MEGDKMQGDISIRLAGPGDAGLLEQVRGQMFGTMRGTDAAGQVQAMEWPDALGDPQYAIVLALRGRCVMGMAAGTVMPQPDKSIAFFINEIGVLPAQRRKGIATRMIRYVFGIAAARGCKTVLLGTEWDNAAAQALYRGLGGRETRGIVIYDWDLMGDGAILQRVS
jgi:ribosomal protein S18 acetylase RimI-like enzyme